MQHCLTPENANAVMPPACPVDTYAYGYKSEAPRAGFPICGDGGAVAADWEK